MTPLSRDEEIEVTFFGHAMTRIGFSHGAVLTDPVLRRHVGGFLEWVAPLPSLEGVDADVVLVSHLHHDHCDLPSLRRLGRERTLVVPYGSEGFFRRRGLAGVVTLRPGESYEVGNLAVTATPASHDGRRYPVGPPASPALGYLVAAGGMRVYFAGDTGWFSGLRDLACDLTVALLPVAGWGRGLGPGHLDPHLAAEAARVLDPKVAIPIHWGALRPFWQSDADQVTGAAATRFAEGVSSRSPGVTPVVLQPGESTPVPASAG